jgi:hypothetical protein
MKRSFPERQPDTFDAYLRGFSRRHGDARNRLFAAVGDHFVIIGALLALRPRRRPWGALVALAGTALIVGGHLLFEHNLGDELAGVARHPLWAARADGRMIRAMYGGRGRDFEAHG